MKCLWIGSGGNQESVVRTGLLNLPLVLSIIGGRPTQFAPLVDLYKRAAEHGGHDASLLPVASHSHELVGGTDDEAADKFFPSMQYAMNVLGKERGWGPYSRQGFDVLHGPEGALYVGSPETVAITRFMLYTSVGTMKNHDDVLRSVELLGTKVPPIVREEIAAWEAAPFPALGIFVSG